MKIGFIFECGPDGADKQVCEFLAREIRPDITPLSRTLDNKPRLLQDCGLVTAKLLKEGCERVLIIWDLRPAWPGKTACRKVERDAVLASLTKAGVADKPVFLVCVEQELEGWLLADEQKISVCLSTDAHPYRVPRVGKPDRVANPKSVMMNHFKTARGWRYEDRTHAIKVLRAAPTNLSRLRRSPTFSRFESKLIAALP
ncbi:MAG: DUF4276 family protein [Candidatus Contendobacter sp.]|nr:DUF4276 family protein [Candidatus Contendobacter sp.]MDG4556469.1 DUF4276 family protein [Candidatus Contendobacter sp.]